MIMTSETNWIKITNDVTTHPEPYAALLFCTNKGETFCGYIHENRWFYDFSHKVAISSDSWPMNIKTDNILIIVTHWMPIPDNPYIIQAKERCK